MNRGEIYHLKQVKPVDSEIGNLRTLCAIGK